MPLQNFGIVDPSLYRGAEPDADGYHTLTTLGVTYLYRLNVGANPPGWQGHVDLLGQDSNFSSTWNPDEGRVRAAVERLDALGRVGIRVFVHCQHGRDRTGLVIGAYRLIKQGYLLGAVMMEREIYGTNSFLDFTSDAVIVHILEDIAKQPRPAA